MDSERLSNAHKAILTAAPDPVISDRLYVWTFQTPSERCQKGYLQSICRSSCPPSVRPPRLNRLLQRLKMDNLTGLRLIAEGTSLADRGVDIVAIHGLGGYDNWKHPTDGPSDDSEAIFWLRDFLPIDLPSARIFTYHYIVSTICADEGIEVIADKLLTKLQNLQKDNVKRPRPLVFICHSLGSLLLQCALVRAFDNKGDKSLNEIIRSTQGIVFLGAPHSTSFQELSTGVLRIAAASKTTQVTMGAIKRMGQILLRFASLPLHSLPWKVVHCFEELPLPSTGLRAVDASRGESWALPPVSLYSHHLDLCRFATQQDLSYIKVLQSLRNITSGSRSPVVDETTQATTLSSIEDEVLRILQIEDASTSVRDASRGTCDWILKHDIYKSWLDMPSQPLWIIGNPGSGKSTMMKHIVEYHRLQKEPNRVLMQFFFGFGSNQSVKSLLSSLLHQLLKAAPTTQTFEIFSRLLERRELEGPNKTWGNDILAESLLKLADKSTATGDSLFIIIDALDECDDPGMVVDLLQRLNSLNSRRRIHICISSRPYNFLTQLRPVTEIRMEDNNSFDIERYLHSRLSILGDHLPPTLDVKTITQTLTGRAQGGFLWVSLVMSRLSCDSYFKTLDTEKDFTPSLPTSLEEAYETILRRLWSLHDGGHRKAAQDALILVLCAQRPLSILELWSALAATHDDLDFFTARVEFGTHRQSSYEEIPQSKERAPLDMTVQLMVLCGGLLEVIPWPSKSPNDTSCATKSTVRLVHSSVRDFFLGNLSHALESDDKRSQDPKSLQLPEQRGARYRHAQYHFQVGCLCLLYVNHVDADFHITKDKTSNSSTPFLAYSLSFGMLHLSLAEQMGVTPMTEDTHQFPPFQKRCLEQWTLLHHQMFEDQRLFEPRKTKAVHIMSYYGFPWYTSGLWAADLADINEQDHYGRTALHLAAAMGHHAICESLLLHGADISHRDHVYGQTPLIVAAAHGQRRVVQLLLSKGSNHDDRMSGVTPLWLAVRSGSRDTVELLLDAGADPKATSIHTGETCLSRAAALGHVRVIHLLLEHGAEVVTWDNIGWTPLHHAVSRGRKKTLEVLLSFLTPDQLYKLKDSFSDGNTDSSWITKVLRAIILWVCYKRGGESQTRAAGDESTQLPRTTVRSRGPKKLGRRGQKHRRDDESEGDDCEEDDKGIPEKRARRSNPSGRRFACPYHKRNEARFSTGACNGTGFENIDRLKRHLKKRHDRATGWRRCSNCRQLFLREEYVGHAPCERQDRPIDYEDGYDQDQAEDLLPKNICLRSGTEESCWKRIFKVLFPDWPQDREVPSPYHETQVQVISTNYVQAIQEHRNIVMDPRTISHITAFQNEEETRQFMDRLIGSLESNFGLVPSTTGNLLPEAMPTVPSQQPNVSNQYLEPQFMPPPEIPLYRLNGSFYNEGYPSFSNPTVSTSHESSSQFLPEDTQADRYTEYTAASDQFSTVFECGWAIPSMGSSMNSSQLQQQLVPPSAPQQPADNTDYNLESGLSGTNQGPDLTHSLLDSRRGSGRHSSWQDLEQGNPPPEWL